MTLRTLGSSSSADNDIKASLLTNESFVYAHLVKIEKVLWRHLTEGAQDQSIIT